MSNIQKTIIDQEFINNLITKSWQDIEELNSQINFIDTSNLLGQQAVKALQNLATSYYVFVGCLEGIDKLPVEKSAEKIPEIDNIEVKTAGGKEEIPFTSPVNNITQSSKDFEPFEYFVDFDEPVGEKLTDADLYNN